MDESSALYGDDPLVGSDAGHDRGDLVARLVRSLALMNNRTDSAVVALVGPWGSGKSTVLNAVERTLQKEGKWQTARYNPWSYSSLDSAIPGFFSELNSALPEELQEKGTRKKVGSWISSISPLGSLGSLAGVDAAGIIDGLGKLVSGDASPEQLRAKVVEDLRALKHPVLMLIDDLDRLGPDELLTTFKLVRMLGRLPNVYYLLCYDEATLIDVLRRTGLVDNDSGRARAYLEKMIQLRLDIPTMLSGEQLELLNLVLAEVQKNHGFELLPSESERFSSMWWECMRSYLAQPRAVKRLFTQVDAAWAELSGEVDFPDFVAMTFIRTFEPAVFALIEEHDAELLGQYSEWDPLVKESYEEKWARWSGYMTDLEAVHPHKLLNLLAKLFLPLRSAKNKTSYGAEARTDIGRRCGVGHQDYFYRFTQAGVPRDDLPNSKVAEALRQLGEGESGDASEEVEKFLAENASMVVQKIMRHDHKDLPTEPLVLMLARQYDVIGKEGSGIQTGPPSFEMLTLGRYLLSGLEADLATHLLNQCSVTSSGLAFVSDILRDLGKPEREEAVPEWLAKAKSNAADAIEAQLRGLDPRGPEDEIERTLRCLWALRDFTDSSRATRLLWELIDGDKGWQAATFIALLLPIGHSSDGTWMLDRHHLSAELIEQLLGFERAAAALKDAGEGSDAPGLLQRFEARPTLSQRVACVYADFPGLADEVRATGSVA